MSAESIEIAVVLEDSVLAVEHIGSPRSSRRATWALAGAALLGALLFTGLAIHAVAIAAENQREAKTWADAGGMAYDFRPRRLHPASDLAAIVSLSTALGCGVWALYRRRREASRFVVGRGRGADFALDVPDTTLVAASGDGFTFTPLPGMALPAGPIARGSTLRAAAGATTFIISSVAAPRPSRLLAAPDRRAMGYAGLSAVAHAVLVALFFLIPAEGNGFIVDDLGALRRRARFDFKPQEAPKTEPGESGGAATPGGATAPAERGERGALGSQESTAQQRRGKIRRTAESPTLARATDEDHAAARTAGILGVVRAQRAQLTALTSLSDFSSGLDDEDIRGGWRGDEVGDSRGFGTGIHGDGPGGGRHLYATIGAGPSRPGPYGGPSAIGPGVLPQRRPKPTFEIGTPTVPEGIDKNMIRRYVRQKSGQITHCYERELVATPGLAGTTTTAFTIDAQGRVIVARAGGLGVAAVERCVEDVLRSIQFPVPGGDGIVNVTSYPFTFHRVGD